MGAGEGRLGLQIVWSQHLLYCYCKARTKRVLQPYHRLLQVGTTKGQAGEQAGKASWVVDAFRQMCAKMQHYRQYCPPWRDQGSWRRFWHRFKSAWPHSLYPAVSAPP